MIYSLFLMLQVAVFLIFFTAFFTKQEIIWAISLVLSGTLMVSSYNVGIQTNVFNSVIGVYEQVFVAHSFPVMMGINMIFFVLSLILGMLDYFDKYGITISNLKLKKQ